jgi:DNA-binding winged helix-turn-helix (wHTH) protein
MPRIVDVYIRHLREKIESRPEDPLYIKTVRGVGYLFDAAASLKGGAQAVLAAVLALAQTLGTDFLLA